MIPLLNSPPVMIETVPSHYSAVKLWKCIHVILVSRFCFFVLIILYSLYLEYDSPLIPSASGLAG